MRMTALILAVLAGTVAAAPRTSKSPSKKIDPIPATVQQVEQALAQKSSYHLRGAIDRTCTFRDTLPDTRFLPVAAALARGCRHKDSAIAVACVHGLAKLKIKGSGRYLAKLLRPTGKIDSSRVAVHVAAIRAAGRIHDTGSLPALEKLLHHRRIEFANEAARAFAGYRWIDYDRRLALGRRLARRLASLERAAQAKRPSDKRKHAKEVAPALMKGLQKLFGHEYAMDARAWARWLKTQKREAAA